VDEIKNIKKKYLKWEKEHVIICHCKKVVCWKCGGMVRKDNLIYNKNNKKG
jgi:hypothetical protein